MGNCCCNNQSSEYQPIMVSASEYTVNEKVHRDIESYDWKQIDPKNKKHSLTQAFAYYNWVISAKMYAKNPKQFMTLWKKQQKQQVESVVCDIFARYI